MALAIINGWLSKGGVTVGFFGVAGGVGEGDDVALEVVGRGKNLAMQLKGDARSDFGAMALAQDSQLFDVPRGVDRSDFILAGIEEAGGLVLEALCDSSIIC